MNASLRLPSSARAIATAAGRRVVALTAAVLLAVLLALTAASAPAAAVESTSSTQEEGGRPQVAATPRDQLGLVLYGVLGAVLVGGIMTANRQLKGRRPQASGEFRWR